MDLKVEVIFHLKTLRKITSVAQSFPSPLSTFHRKLSWCKKPFLHQPHRKAPQTKFGAITLVSEPNVANDRKPPIVLSNNLILIVLYHSLNSLNDEYYVYLVYVPIGRLVNTIIYSVKIQKCIHSK